MNHGPTDAGRIIRRFLAALRAADDRTVIILSAGALADVVAGFALRDRPDIMRRRAEHLDREDKGAFTGENVGADGEGRRRDVRARRPLGAPPRLRRDGRADGEEVRGRVQGRAHADAVRRREARGARAGHDAGGGAAPAPRGAQPPRADAGRSDGDRLRAGVGDRHRPDGDAGGRVRPCTRRFAERCASVVADESVRRSRFSTAAA